MDADTIPLEAGHRGPGDLVHQGLLRRPGGDRPGRASRRRPGGAPPGRAARRGRLRAGRPGPRSATTTREIGHVTSAASSPRLGRSRGARLRPPRVRGAGFDGRGRLRRHAGDGHRERAADRVGVAAPGDAPARPLAARRHPMTRSATARGAITAAVVAVALAGSPAPTPLAARQAGPFTIEQILAAPFPSEIVAAPAGAARRLGVRRSRLAQPVGGRWAGFAGRRVTAYQGDDGQEITDLAFSPDGATIVYVRGGGPNRAGEIPNPTSDAAGAEQAVWAVPVAGGAPRQLGSGQRPRRSHPGAIAWRSSSAGRSGSRGCRARRRRRRRRERAAARAALAWSPDGSRLAFVSGRGTHAFVGVLDVATKALTWLDPSLDTDDAPGVVARRRPRRLHPPAAGPRPDDLPPRARGPAVVDPRGRRRHRHRARGVAGGARAAAACSSRSSSVRSSSGPPTSAWCSRGRAMAGSICIRCRPPAARRCCSRQAASKSTT